MTKRRLITAALPYANNIPHLGNLIQVLSADAFARFCRLAGYRTLYVCGTDEYGTATETRAAQEGVSPRELCDRYHAIHSDIYKWFNINFDKFGRTSTPVQTEVVQGIFEKLDAAGFVCEHDLTQLYCEQCRRFLADRFVRGVCPHCGSSEARGDQCENCGKLLDPTDLKEPRCHLCGSTPVAKDTKHLYIDLPKIKDRLEAWIKTASEKGFWANNALQMTQAWIRDGLRERAISRDLKWGIPVPRPGYENKVFYVWFDAPIGYISITGCLGDELVKAGLGGSDFADWQSFVDYWWKKPEEVELFQFIGKDNIPFHTVVFPSSLLGSGEKWTMLHHMSSTEYLNYESGKFSKSRGIGVFGSDVMGTGIPADVWRFYLFYNRPEKSDVVFTWKDFQEKVNGELIGNFGNLVNRTLSFITRYYDGEMPEGKADPALWEQVVVFEKSITEKLERADLRDAFREVFALSSFANKYFQDSEPWRLRTENPQKAKAVIRDLAHVVRDLAVLAEPYMPQTAESIFGFLGLDCMRGVHTQDLATQGSPCDVKRGMYPESNSLPEQPYPVRSAAGLVDCNKDLNWNVTGSATGIPGGKKIESKVLFSKLEDKDVEAFREQFSGNLEERQNENKVAAVDGNNADKKPEEAAKPALPKFEETVDLRVAKIEKVERHPNADKLYVLGLEIGEGTSGEREERTIVSGLVGFYTEEQLVGKRIIVAYNLKPAKLRGIQSCGMLLAAGDNGGTASDGSPAERCEVLDAGDTPTGTRLLPEGAAAAATPAQIDIDTFFSFPIAVNDFAVHTGAGGLCLNGKPLCSSVIKEGKVN